jgi:small multidrug resistance pump
MAWVWLSVAILTEVAATTSMKLAEGFAKPVWVVAMVIGYAVSFAAMVLALKQLDITLVYAVWSGLGTVAIAAIGIYVFNEPGSAFKFGSIALIVIGVVGLNLSGSGH